MSRKIERHCDQPLPLPEPGPQGWTGWNWDRYAEENDGSWQAAWESNQRNWRRADLPFTEG